MKLIIQIPCYNEAENLCRVLEDIPHLIPGIQTIEILVVDDGSTDRTYEKARSLGAAHVVRLKENQGLAAAFAVGLDTCLRLGADIIVNMDADNQYRGADIPRLIAPILNQEADFVIGNRNILGVKEFSITKKLFQLSGSWIIRKLSGVQVKDATSGFRALSREAALRMNVISRFTYTLETLIEAGKRGIVTKGVEIGVNPKIRESRLFKNIPEYLGHSIATILRIYATYKPLKVFVVMGFPLLATGAFCILRWFYLWALVEGRATGHIQLLQFGALFLTIGVLVICFGVIADLSATNRQLLENLLYLFRRDNLPPTEKPSENLR